MSRWAGSPGVTGPCFGDSVHWDSSRGKKGDRRHHWHSGQDNCSPPRSFHTPQAPEHLQTSSHSPTRLSKCPKWELLERTWNAEAGEEERFGPKPGSRRLLSACAHMGTMCWAAAHKLGRKLDWSRWHHVNIMGVESHQTGMLLKKSHTLGFLSDAAKNIEKFYAILCSW